VRFLLRAITVIAVVGLSLGHWLAVGNFAAVEKSTPVMQSVSVEPLPLQVFCPGAFVEVGGPSGVELGSIGRVGEALIASYVSAQEVIGEIPISSEQGSGAIAEDAQQSTNLLSLLQVQAVDRERAAGLAASYCQQPRSSGWLINGSAVVGSESVLIAANPSEIEAIIDLEIHLPGRIVTDRFALAPFEQQLISTAGYANGESAFAVFFQSSGPALSMALQNRQTRGLTPTGIEIEPLTADPATEHVFAGFRPLTAGFENPAMRVYNPGSAATEVIITAFGDENVELFRANVQAGNFAEIELLVQEGFQLVTLASTEPVIAAIKNSSIEPVLDFGWVQPAQRFTSVSIPLTMYQNTLVIANPQSLPIEVTVEILSSGRSSVQNVVVAPFDSLAIPVRGTSVRLESDLEFAVAIEILDELGYSLVHPTESRNLGLDLSIQVR
jgi:hypothetical protein